MLDRLIEELHLVVDGHSQARDVDVEFLGNIVERGSVPDVSCGVFADPLGDGDVFGDLQQQLARRNAGARRTAQWVAEVCWM